MWTKLHLSSQLLPVWNMCDIGAHAIRSNWYHHVVGAHLQQKPSLRESQLSPFLKHLPASLCPSTSKGKTCDFQGTVGMRWPLPWLREGRNPVGLACCGQSLYEHLRQEVRRVMNNSFWMAQVITVSFLKLQRNSKTAQPKIRRSKRSALLCHIFISQDSS